jgi:hypothetical protein
MTGWSLLIDRVKWRIEAVRSDRADNIATWLRMVHSIFGLFMVNVPFQE